VIRKAAIEDHNRVQREYFESSVKRTMVPETTPYIRRQVDELLGFAGVRSDSSVLEVGCGMGRYTLPLADRGVRVEGLDLSPVLLDRLRDYDGGRHEIPLHCADVVDHPRDLDGRFDAVVGFFTLHHLHDLPACFSAMSRFLRPGGRIAFLEPNAWNPLYYLQILLTPHMTWAGDGGVAKMRREVLFGAMRSAGFVRPELRRFGFFPPFLANRPWGARAERSLESIRGWRPLLPFQLVGGERP
jgi:SAM-dependent methyltransferase